MLVTDYHYGQPNKTVKSSHLGQRAVWDESRRWRSDEIGHRLHYDSVVSKKASWNYLVAGRKKNGRKGMFHFLLKQKHPTDSNKSSRQRVITSSSGSQPELNRRSYSYVCASTDLCPALFCLFVCFTHGLTKSAAEWIKGCGLKIHFSSGHNWYCAFYCKKKKK